MVVKNGGNAFLCPVGDVQAFADAIVYSLNHQNELVRMKKACRSAEKFTGERII